MNSSATARRRIETLAQTFLPRKGQMRPASAHPRPAAGQLWLTRPDPGFPDNLPAGIRTDDPVRLILLEAGTGNLKGHRLHLAAPIIENPAMAGPDDLILPKEVLGHRVAVAAGMACTVLQDGLDRCRGCLPPAWLSSLQAFQEGLLNHASPPANVQTGLPYLDEHDVRYLAHRKLADGLAYLQEPVLAWAEACGTFGKALAPPITARALREVMGRCWKRVQGWCKAAGEAAAWAPPEPGVVYAAGPERRAIYPVVRLGPDGSRRIIARAEESIPLPRDDASWRLAPPVKAIANKLFAILPSDSGLPLGYGRVNDRGARLSLTELFSKKFPPDVVLVIIND
ncbi:MAG: hypothetical protein GX608_02310 [Lentisphaerae bacterium]|nr:hypothetical protein [Lentisphaerota bacterium]